MDEFYKVEEVPMEVNDSKVRAFITYLAKIMTKMAMMAMMLTMMILNNK